jgi:hypothetical protein
MKFLKVLSVLVVASLLIYQTAFAQTGIEESEGVEPENNKILDLIPAESRVILETQNNDYLEVVNHISSEFGSFEAFNDYGTIYLNKKGEIEIGISKESLKIKSLKEKLKTIKNSHKIKYKSINYSKKDLINTQEKLQSEIERLKDKQSFNPGTIVINIDDVNGEVILEVEKDLDKAHELFQKKFDETLIIKTLEKEELPVQEISRVRDWTKLGGGIAVKDDGKGNCTTAAIARKDTRYFLITAGHCLDADGSGALQIYNRVGTDHSRANGAGLDVGLILLDDTNTLPGGRKVTSYFYWHAGNDTDYDQRIKGAGLSVTMPTGMYLCKSGITTNVTCGTVKYTSTTVDYGDGFGAMKVARINNDNAVSNDYSMGGDSGSIIFDPYSFLIYGIHSGGEEPTGGPNTYGYFTKIWEVTDHYGTSSNPMYIYTSTTDIQLPE